MCNGANCRHRTKLNLRAALSPDHLAEPDDILDTKKTLMALGYYRPVDGTEPGAWVDTDLFNGIRQFQRDNGLKVDALMRPGGPTEQAMNTVLEAAPPPPAANDDQKPANDDQAPWDEAANGKHGTPGSRLPNKGPTQDERDDHKPGVPGGKPASECWGAWKLNEAKCVIRYRRNPNLLRTCIGEAFQDYSNCITNRKIDRPLPDMDQE